MGTGTGRLRSGVRRARDSVRLIERSCTFGTPYVILGTATDLGQGADWSPALARGRAGADNAGAGRGGARGGAVGEMAGGVGSTFTCLAVYDRQGALCS